MLRWIGTSLLLIFFSVKVLAIQGVVSHSVFYIPASESSLTSKPYVEAYWELDPGSVNYTRTKDGIWIGKIRTDIVLSNKDGVIKSDHYILQTSPKSTYDQAQHQTILDLRRYVIQPGHVKLEITFTDLSDTGNKYAYSDTFSVARPSATKAYYSDIELLDTAYYNTSQTIFSKNNMQQIPFCTNFYDSGRNVLHYYFELYNANTISKADHPLVQTIFISKKTDEGPVLNLEQTDTINGNKITPMIGSFVISDLPSGNFYLNAKLTDKNKITVASRSFMLQRYNTRALNINTLTSKNFDTGFQKVKVFDVQKTFVAKYSLPELKAILKMILPVATPIEAQAIRSFQKTPDENYIRYFIYNHFSDINKKDPGKAWDAYADKVREVNRLFGTPAKTGYECDRGFIYLKYGKPDEQITVEAERGSRPYELWQYNNIAHKYSNVVFLFYRPDYMTDHYKLLHTTIPGEFHDPNWRTYLYIDGQNTSDHNSRAEQYIGNR